MATVGNCLVLRSGAVPYEDAWGYQKTLVKARQEGARGDVLLLMEHPHTYTLGRIGLRENLLVGEEELARLGVALHQVDRGGDITYHGPGQLVAYPILDLTAWERDAHAYLRRLEGVLIKTLSDLGIAASAEPGYTGVWVGERKIAAIGVKVSRWITMHGFALNVNTELSYFSHIVPCGLKDKEVTSIQRELGKTLEMSRVMDRVVIRFGEEFGLRMIDSALVPARVSGTEGAPNQEDMAPAS